ncbi:MAG: hypothetical protein WD889_01370, partial [Candidatus Colwellbacteria bacterium]
MSMRKFGYFLPLVVIFLVFGFLKIDSNFNDANAATANPSDFGLKEGDLISAAGSNDPDIYIINEHGFKRLFLNPAIFGFYGHLGGFSNVKNVTPQTRDAFITSGLFRNCETNDPQVYGVEITGEDSGLLHWVNTSGSQAVAEDPEFFSRTFCINSNEFGWYPQAGEYTSVSQIPDYSRGQIALLPDATPVPGYNYAIGNRVRTTESLVVRELASTLSKALGTQGNGSTGTIIDGPVLDGTLIRWKIDFDSGVDGWVIERLEHFTSSPIAIQPTPTPAPAGTTPQFALPPRGQAVSYDISSGSTSPVQFSHVDINPLHVFPGDTQHLTIKVSSPHGIKEVFAVTKLDTKTLTLNLADDGTGTNTWKTFWIVTDTHVKIYHTKFTATDNVGNSNSTTFAWSDPCEGWSDGTDSNALSSDCTISVIDGVDGGSFQIPSGKTVTLNSGATLVFNPGKSITIDGTIAIAKGAVISKGYLFWDDTDEDTYPGDLLNKQFNTTSTLSGHVRTLNDSGTVDYDDTNASCWRGRYADTDGDGVGAGSITCVGDQAGYSDSSTDCASTDATRWVTRACYTDADNDLYTVGSTTSNVCKGSACNSPTGHQAVRSSEDDCDDTDPLKKIASDCYSYAQAY